MSINSAADHQPEPHAPEQEPAQEPVSAPALPGRQPRNQHLKIADPKSRQFTGRATEAEFARISRAIEVRKQGKTGTYDIVRLALEMLDYIEADIFQTFKTK